ncbi:MAG: DUF2892 domain-containing protein [Bacillus sp. (in: firmicutes)]
MNSRQNIGTVNAIIRITCGLTTLSVATAKLVRRPMCISTIIWAAAGAMKVAEGIARYCPVTDMIQNRSAISESMMEFMDEADLGGNSNSVSAEGSEQ